MTGASSPTRRLWGGAAGVTIAGALLSLVGSQTMFGAAVDCSNATQACGGECPPGERCAFDFSPTNGTQNGGRPCTCQPVGCCEATNLVYGQEAAPCANNVTQQECNKGLGGFVPGGNCGLGGCETPTPTATPTSTPTLTPTATPTVTPTNTRLPIGDDCEDPSDCVSGNCVDDVCCDTPCNQPGQICNQPGDVGTCSSVLAPAPAASNAGLVVIILALIAIGSIAVLRLRSSDR